MARARVNAASTPPCSVPVISWAIPAKASQNRRSLAALELWKRTAKLATAAGFEILGRASSTRRRAAATDRPAIPALRASSRTPPMPDSGAARALRAQTLTSSTVASALAVVALPTRTSLAVRGAPKVSPAPGPTRPTKRKRCSFAAMRLPASTASSSIVVRLAEVSRASREGDARARSGRHLVRRRCPNRPLVETFRQG